VDRVRAANDRFKDISVAVSEGYEPIPCASGIDGGQLFNFTGAPNRYGLDPFYELHVWAWKANPRGAFADMNPNVTCEHAAGHR
jgi:hypothetical protein